MNEAKGIWNEQMRLVYSILSRRSAYDGHLLERRPVVGDIFNLLREKAQSRQSDSL